MSLRRSESRSFGTRLRRHSGISWRCGQPWLFSDMLLFLNAIQNKELHFDFRDCKTRWWYTLLGPKVRMDTSSNHNKGCMSCLRYSHWTYWFCCLLVGFKRQHDLYYPQIHRRLYTEIKRIPTPEMRHLILVRENGWTRLLDTIRICFDLVWIFGGWLRTFLLSVLLFFAQVGRPKPTQAYMHSWTC